MSDFEFGQCNRVNYAKPTTNQSRSPRKSIQSTTSFIRMVYWEHGKVCPHYRTLYTISANKELSDINARHVSTASEQRQLLSYLISWDVRSVLRSDKRLSIMMENIDHELLIQSLR